MQTGLLAAADICVLQLSGCADATIVSGISCLANDVNC